MLKIFLSLGAGRQAGRQASVLWLAAPKAAAAANAPGIDNGIISGAFNVV